MLFLSWILSALAFLLLLFLSMAIVYLFFFAVSYWLCKSTKAKVTPPQKRFAILIPAHNEEKVLRLCLESIQNLNYYKNLYHTYIIADNCSDHTAQLARNYPAQVLERQDTQRIGKGYALAWGLEKVNLDSYDAVLFVDADCILQENLLLALNQRILKGQSVLQTYNGIYNIRQNFLTYLLYLGSLLENHLFYGGREALGLSSLLRGTGMCFSTQILRKHGWRSFSETEDLEFSLKLLEDGTKVNFVPETKVLAIQPSRLLTAYSQKRRWAGGTFKILKKHFPALVRRGLRTRRLELLEMAFALTLLSRPLLIYMNLFCLLVALFLPAGQRTHLLGWGIILLLVQTLYLALSVFLAENRIRGLKSLIWAPFYLAWLAAVHLLSLTGAKKQTWQKTPRENA